MNRTTIISILIVLLLAGVGLVLARNNNLIGNTATTNDRVAGVANSPGSSASPSVSPFVQSNGGRNNSNGQVKEFTIQAQNYSFTPNEIRVKQGDRVKITLTNSNGFHDWTLDEFNAKTKVIQAGQSDTVEFTADKAGTYEFYCSVDGHRQMGMVGKFIVE